LISPQDRNDFFAHKLTFSSCVTCATGSYSFENPYKASYCNQCPAQIDCYGGSQVGPKRGYWMENSNDLMAIKCPYPSACLGGYVDYEYFPSGKCSYPHQGNLCNQCAPTFAKFGSQFFTFEISPLNSFKVRQSVRIVKITQDII